MLDKTENVNCAVFPKGIDINITFTTNDFDPSVLSIYTATISDFDYNSTNVIILSDLPVIPASIDNLFVEFSTYAEIT